MLINNYVELSGRWMPSTEREKKGGYCGSGKKKIKDCLNGIETKIPELYTETT